MKTEHPMKKIAKLVESQEINAPVVGMQIRRPGGSTGTVKQRPDGEQLYIEWMNGDETELNREGNDTWVLGTTRAMLENEPTPTLNWQPDGEGAAGDMVVTLMQSSWQLIAGNAVITDESDRRFYWAVDLKNGDTVAEGYAPTLKRAQCAAENTLKRAVEEAQMLLGELLKEKS
jgi:hypothetical protein